MDTNLICTEALAMIWSSPHRLVATRGSANVTNANARNGFGIYTSTTWKNKKFNKYDKVSPVFQCNRSWLAKTHPFHGWETDLWIHLFLAECLISNLLVPLSCMLRNKYLSVFREIISQVLLSHLLSASTNKYLPVQQVWVRCRLKHKGYTTTAAGYCSNVTLVRICSWQEKHNSLLLWRCTHKMKPRATRPTGRIMIKHDHVFTSSRRCCVQDILCKIPNK